MGLVTSELCLDSFEMSNVGHSIRLCPRTCHFVRQSGNKKIKKHKYSEKSKLLKNIYEQKLDISWKVTLEAFNIL